MPLINILNDFASYSGLDKTASTSQRTFALNIINKAAEDLYSIIDTINCLREQIFRIDCTTRQCALPFYVGEIRGIRDFQTGLNYAQHDMRPRYSYSGWKEQYKNYNMLIRNKGLIAVENFALNSSLLTFRFPTGQVSEKAFNIIITGQTPYSQRIQETLSFAIGDSEKTTVNSFEPQFIESIRKNVTNNFDINIYDVDDELLGMVPNSELGTRYILIQIPDFPFTQDATNSYVEIMYKQRFSPFVNDYDVFPGDPEKYDTAIFWKSIEHWAARKAGKSDVALLAHKKCAEVMQNINEDAGGQNELEMNFAPNQYLNMPSSAYLYDPRRSGGFFQRGS